MTSDPSASHVAGAGKRATKILLVTVLQFAAVTAQAQAGNAGGSKAGGPNPTAICATCEPNDPPPPNSPPYVALTAPSEGSTQVAPATFNVQATANDTDGSIASVKFYSGSTLLGTDTTAPYSAIYSNVPAGSYAFTAVATDNSGSSTTSTVTTVTVTTPPSNSPPTVSLLTPADGESQSAPGSFVVQAVPFDSDGSIVSVKFFSGGTLIGSDTTDPYILTYSNVPAGSYALTAAAYDNAGAVTVSAPVNVTVTIAPPPPPPPSVGVPNPDSVSDRVGATPGTFSVDSSGAATYTMPIYAAPGTAGVTPRMALSYNSLAPGDYAIGKGWSISGASNIQRCRASREAGDFIVNGQPVDGQPFRIAWDSRDRFCLDGQRLVPAPVSAAPCAPLAGATAAQFRTEVDSFQRICAYSFDAALGPRFFTIERKDGSISWYGDRTSTSGGASGPRPDGILLATSTNWSNHVNRVLNWAQVRFQDSTGNYIDYLYWLNPGSGSGALGEQQLAEVQYTGKVVLPGQAGSASSPYAKIVFNYAGEAWEDHRLAYLTSGQYWHTRKLSSITVLNGSYVRHYNLNRAKSPSGSGANVLASIQECSDPSASVCLPATRFDVSVAKHQLGALELPNDINIGSYDKFEGYKLADVDGDGRQDFVWLSDGNTGQACTTEYVNVAFGSIDATTGANTFSQPAQAKICTPAEEMSDRNDTKGMQRWYLFDYNGDGKADILMSGQDTTSSYWKLYPSQGRPSTASDKVFNDANNLIGNTILGTPDLNLGDFNGDGLLDVIYTYGGLRSADDKLKYRLMERVAGGFAWGAQREVTASLGLETLTLEEKPRLGGTYVNTGGFQLFDFNGDSRSDLVLRIRTGNAGNGINYNESLFTYYAYTDSAGQLQFSFIGSFFVGYKTSDGEMVYSKHDHRFADFNGDGLTDVAYGGNGFNWGTWYYRINTGYALATAPETVLSTFATDASNYIQFSDINGDGLADLLLPSPDLKTFDVMYSAATGGFSARTAVPGGAQLIGCNDISCVSRFSFIFNDFDSDGAVEFFSIKWKTSSNDPPEQRLRSARADVASRFKPRDLITRVTNGIGAINEIAYLPMTISDIYRRDSGTRALNWGRGSAVLDVSGSGYVVAKHSWSAPTANNPLDMASTYYRYFGARAQAGGRGNLGFKRVEAINANTLGKMLISSTTFNQNFPFIGTPASSQTAVVTGNYTPSPCLTQVTELCFVGQDQPFASLGGTIVETETPVWSAKPAFSPGTQQSVAVAMTQGVSDKFDLAGGARTGRVTTTRTMDDWGNALLESTDTFTGSTDVNPISSTTTNTWANDEARWRLGRLTAAAVARGRNGLSVTRSTSYGYDLSGAFTGLLNSERVQPNGAISEDLRTEYTLDAYGNRIASYTCSQNVATCRTGSVNVSVWSSNDTVHRYAKQTFDANGRYPTSTIETFTKPGTAWGTGEREEVATSTIWERDRFGGVTKATDMFGSVSLALNGALGRGYWTWAPTVAGATPGDPNQGVATFSVFRECGTGTNQVSCPVGATLRQKTIKDGSPTVWAYLDVLSRATLVVTESANPGVSGKDLSGVCTWYDLNGRKSGMSEPFFLAGVAVSGDPSFSANPCSQSARDATYTFYDVLGRPTQMISPDAGSTSIVYSGLSTQTTNPKSQVRTEVKNAAGELVSVTDSVDGLTAVYAYDASGNLASVTRNAGRGDIVTSATYDRLGRKTTINDPDAGTVGYSYNAAGEIEGEMRGSVWTGRRYDFRGRLLWKGVIAVGAGSYEEQERNDYDLGSNARGQLVSTSTYGEYLGWSGTSRPLAKTVTNNYDAMGRLVGVSTQIDGVNYQTGMAYDSLGRLFKRQDASGRWTKNEFTARGYVVRICESSNVDASPGCISGNAATYLEAMESDARGNVTREIRGGSTAMLTERTYDPFTGRLIRICAGTGGSSCQIANEQYGWDNVGNLSFREKSSYREEFYYDGLNRLTNGYYRRLGGTSYTDSMRPISHWASYDKLGNVCAKTVNGVGHAFQYHGRAGCGLPGVSGLVDSDMTSSPHQVVSDAFANTSYGYDADGNQVTALAAVSTNNRYVRYSLSGKAYEIAKGSQSAPSQVSRFWYDAAGAMYKREDFSNVTGMKKVLYIGNVEIATAGGVTTIKRYLAGVAVQDIVGSTITTRYLHVDHLGSVVAITSANGLVEETLDYSPFGERRSFADPRNFTSTGSVNTNQGFTGHEMVDGFGVVHMKGRIYDSVTGRFMQVDPIIQDPSNPQNYDRYTYVWNNPLAYTDPTGMASFRQQLRGLLGGLIVAYLPGSTGIFGNAANGVFANSLSGLLGGLVATGNYKTGLALAFGAGINAGLQNGGDEDIFDGGTLSELTGGKYGDGEEIGQYAVRCPYQLATCKKHFGEPKVATGGIEPYDPSNAEHTHDWSRDMTSSCQAAAPDVCSLTANLTVGGLHARRSTKVLNQFYGNVTYGKRTIAFTFTEVADVGSASIQLVAPTPAVAAGHNNTDNPLYGAMLFHTQKLYVTDWVTLEWGVIPHEFGHGLGMYHAPNATGRMMSYKFSADKLTEVDFNLLWNQYFKQPAPPPPNPAAAVK